MKSKVYFQPVVSGEAKASICKKIASLCEAVGLKKYIKKDNLVALKMHMGEGQKKMFVPSEFVKPIVELVRECGGKPFVTDTNTLYTGRRSNAVDHLMMAYENGFSIENLGCPVIIGDGLVGENQVSIPADRPTGQPADRLAHLCGLARRADVIIGIAHCTGHLLTGYGGALKNIGMGLAGRGGKLDQHSGLLPDISIDECVGCELCLIHCPARAITLVSPTCHSEPQRGEEPKKAVIDADKCYGCGECYAVCPNGAVRVDKWSAASDMVQSKLARYCAAILKDRKALFINFAVNVTRNCDCLGEPEKPMAKDVGILASIDPVAVDTASIEMINKQAGKQVRPAGGLTVPTEGDVFKEAWPDIDYNIQLREAEKLGVGATKYEIAE